MTLRADASRNRAALVDAARGVFAEQGLDVPLDEIARRAGIGNATLYRRFPTRGDLVAAVFADRMTEHIAAVEAGLADADPWRGFVSYVQAVTAMQARDRGIADLVTMDLTAAPAIAELQARAFAGLVRLIERAHAAGLRADVTTEDVVLILMANAGLVERAPGIAAAASTRLVHVLLDGLRAPAATDGPRAPSPARVRTAMRRNGERRLGKSRAAPDRSSTTTPSTTAQEHRS